MFQTDKRENVKKKYAEVNLDFYVRFIGSSGDKKQKQILNTKYKPKFFDVIPI